MTLSFEVTVRAAGFTLEASGTVEDGITGLFGPSGAGKTTLLHALAGLRTVDRGRIELDGRVLLDTSAGIDRPPEARRVGMVFQEGRLFPHLDVAANLRFGAAGGSGHAGAPSFEEVVALLELGPLLGRRPAGLSGGERQRVALGRALLAAPRVLLLDEPLASLDRERRGQILPYLRRLPTRFGVPALHVTHDLPELLSLTDRLILLEDGVVRGAGRYRDLAVEGTGATLERVNVLAGKVIEASGANCRVRVARTRPEGSGSDSTDGAVFAAVGRAPARGTSGTVTIGAEEIALAVEEIGPTSIQNHIPARVERRTDHAGSTVVELRTQAGGVPLLVSLTTASADRLAVDEGRSVVALVKASAVRWHEERSVDPRRVPGTASHESAGGPEVDGAASDSDDRPAHP